MCRYFFQKKKEAIRFSRVNRPKKLVFSLFFYVVLKSLDNNPYCGPTKWSST